MKLGDRALPLHPRSIFAEMALLVLLSTTAMTRIISVRKGPSVAAGNLRGVRVDVKEIERLVRQCKADDPIRIVTERLTDGFAVLRLKGSTIRNEEGAQRRRTR
jgi:hypothetical protein